MRSWINRARESVEQYVPAFAKFKNRSALLIGYAEREALYAAAVQSSNLAFLTTDMSGVITGWNSGAQQLFGYGAEEAIGRDIEMLVPPNRRDEISLIRGKFQTGQRIDNFRTVRIAKGGRPVHVVFDVSPLRAPAGQLAGCLAVMRDVTEQRLAEELFELAVEACPSGMMMIDRSGRIVMLNSEIEHLFGHSRDALIGQSVEMLLPPAMRTGHVALRAKFNKDPRTRGMGKGRELVGRHRDGIDFPIEIGLYPIHIRHGLLILAVIVDISERKRNERLKDEFVSTVSHELRTPLTSIAASLALLSGGGAGRLPKPAGHLVGIAHSNSQRLVRLVNDILDIEKIESGEMVFHLGPVNICAVVEQAIETSRAYADTLGVKVRLESHLTIGEALADADRLAQVVGNLLSNAIKFSPRGEEVIVGIVQGVETIRLTVRDHGPGIPDDFKPRIFEKFAQADSGNTPPKGGTGLGLSIVRQIVERMGGKVGFESEVGAGALFFVELPRLRENVRPPGSELATVEKRGQEVA
jgi:PAS domain S-box-containing protein